MDGLLGEDIQYRLADERDETLLSQMHHIAAFARSDTPSEDVPPLAYVIRDPEFNIYFRDWGRPGDTGIVAGDVTTETTVGAAWYRAFSREEHQRVTVHGIEMPHHEISIGVLPAYRGRGVGTQLLKHLMGQAQHDGIPALGLGVDINNLGAKRLYARLGFTSIGLIPGCEIMAIQL